MAATIKQSAPTVSLHGGYSCQFVEELTKDLQAECSICLHTVREPHLVDCCGYRFCKTCIEPLLSAKRCPLCNSHFSTVIPDKLLQRTLNHKLVYCTRKSEGCLWTGELAKSEEHEVNCPRKPVMCDLCKAFQAPLEELQQHQKESCPARLVVCPIGCGALVKLSSVESHTESDCPARLVVCPMFGCGALMKLSSVESHTANECPARLVVCPIGCGASLKSSNVENHTQNKCPSRLVMCPNECGASVMLSTTKAHTESECPLTVVNCEFAYAGCLLMMRRMDVTDHLEAAKQEHIEILSEKVKEMDSEIRRLKAENAAKDSKLRMLKATHVKKPAAEPQSSAKVLVRNIPSTATKHNIKSLFGPCGRVKDVKLRGGGMAVVEFVESTSVARTLEKHYSSGFTVFKTKLDVQCYK